MHLLFIENEFESQLEIYKYSVPSLIAVNAFQTPTRLVKNREMAVL